MELMYSLAHTRVCHLLFVLLLAVGAAVCGAEALCPGHAVVGADSQGRLLVCPDDGQAVHIGGGVSALLDELVVRNEHLLQRNADLEKQAASLRAETDRLRAAAWDPFEGAQRVATSYAQDWEYFEIDGGHFLAVANLKNSSSYITTSYIYKFDSVAGLFDVQTPWQSVTTSGASDWEYFEMDGEHFLALACSRSDESSKTTSYIYKYDTMARLFDFTTPFQVFDTNGARDWEHFVVNGEHFLAVAHFLSDTSISEKSVLYRLDSTMHQFTSFQVLETNGAVDLEYFQIADRHFLAVANQRDSSTYSVHSTIFQFDAQDDQFIVALAVPTQAASDWAHFTIDGDHFLAVANAGGNPPSQTSESHIYKFNSTSKEFEVEADKVWQTIVAVGARSWEPFEVRGTFFLALVCDAGSEAVESTIFKYDSITKRFNTFRPFKSTSLSGRDWVAFAIGSRVFHALATNDVGESLIFVSSP